MSLIILSISLLMLLCLKKSAFSSLSSIISRRRIATTVAAGLALIAVGAAPALAQTPGEGAPHRGGESSLALPDLSTVKFLGADTQSGIDGHSLLLIGLLVSFLGMVFGLIIYMQLKKLPVHRAMLEISEMIYETCKTYLITQGKFILILWAFIASVV
ncbi:MAG TPA: hypothetical protein VIC84_01390, partial [Blastocatellia bacterium]